MASVCSPDSRPVEGSLVKPGFYSVLEKLPLEYIGPSERFFLWLEFAFSAMSGTPLNSSVTGKMGAGREGYERLSSAGFWTASGFLETTWSGSPMKTCWEITMKC